MRKTALILFILLLLQACQTRIPQSDQEQPPESLAAEFEESSLIEDFEELSIFICDRGIKTPEELVSLRAMKRILVGRNMFYYATKAEHEKILLELFPSPPCPI